MILLILFMTFISTSLFGQDVQSLPLEMKRLNVNSALIVPSQAVDEYPLWSSDGDFLAANVQGNWIKVDLAHLSLGEGTWRGGEKIGVINSQTSFSEASIEQIESWQKTSTMNLRKVQTSTGTIIELKESGLGVSLIVTKKGIKPVTYWTTDLENCYGLVLSPDQKYVAFIAETNGVIVLQL